MRHIRKRAALATLVIATLAPTAQAQITYKITDLGAPGFMTGSMARHINDNGGIVGSASDFTSRAVRFTPHPPIALPDLNNGAPAIALSSNTSGVVAGFVTVNGGRAPTAWIPNGTGFDRITLNGLGQMLDINASNVAVGSFAGQAVIWNPTTTPTALSTTGLWSGIEANAINDSGQAVGSGFDIGIGRFVGVRWSSSSATPTKFQAFGSTNTRFKDINNASSVAGDYFDAATSSFRAFLWRASDLSPVAIAGPAGATRASANSINNGEQVVGVAGGSLGDRAFLWDAVNGSRYLNDLVDPSTPGWILTNANSINASGSIVGFGTFNGQTRAFRADPIPEPATMTALALGAALLAARKRKKA